MKNRYETPEMKIVNLSAEEDILVLSDNFWDDLEEDDGDNA